MLPSEGSCSVSPFSSTPEYQRPFWLTVALSVMLLVSVSITVAQAANPARLGNEIRRDLGALRAQLELIDPSEPDAGRQTVAFNTDLGDGGPVFQRHSMVTIVAGANRRLERLLESNREQGGDARVHAGESLRTAMYDLQRQTDQLARAADPAQVAAVRERIMALLDRCERELSVLLDQTTHPRALPDVTAQEAARSRRRPLRGSALLRGAPAPALNGSRSCHCGARARGRCYTAVNALLLWRRPAIPPRPARRGSRRPRPPCC